MSPPLVIKNGTVVNEDGMFKADVLVKNGVIVEVSPNIIPLPDMELIDASDRLVIPGGIDPHTHMQMPYMGEVTKDDFLKGTEAAVAGGTTMIIDFCCPDHRNGESLMSGYNRWRGWADPKVCCDYGLSVAITQWRSETAEQMALITSPEYGVNSFKFYMAYEGTLMVRDDEMYRAMQECAKLRALARVHCENGAVIKEKEIDLLAKGVTGPEGHTQSRPEEIEAEATNRACVLAAQANCPLYVVHVMTKGAAAAISHHRAQGSIVFGEPIAAGLALDGSHYYDDDWLHAARYVMSPPLSRDPTTPELLMKLLAAGELHLTGTDNCTYDCRQKSLGKGNFTKIPNGINGVEDRMSVVWEKGVHSGIIDPMRYVSITSATAAKIFNIYPKKGRIAVGSDADIVIFNPNAIRTISADTHHHNLDFNIFEGIQCHGVAEITISSQGICIHQENNLVLQLLKELRCNPSAISDLEPIDIKDLLIVSDQRGRIVWANGKLQTVPGSGKFVPLLSNSPFVFGTQEIRERKNVPRIVERLD
ncbi:hypothetical protein GCK72_000187 [Caenorhabditis remanei]|uniref:dihydropyrimidinase n=1 Tax=Caenorhabditis remanei TaxID=31234 RepID=A0A6A5HLF2_CAERE|nr:hypothetical protein GCK72_000187 [Caenorhabditis remanei]KAF1768375.1 hypothetical protein GCK72_000187 [Caenorhabditis remanei]